MSEESSEDRKRRLAQEEKEYKYSAYIVIACMHAVNNIHMYMS